MHKTKTMSNDAATAGAISGNVILSQTRAGEAISRPASSSLEETLRTAASVASMTIGYMENPKTIVTAVKLYTHEDERSPERTIHARPRTNEGTINGRTR